MENSENTISRRTIVKGAAWSVPVIAVAVATPLAAASGGAVNADANYYWAAEAEGDYTSLDAAGGDLRGTFSTQIAYRADPFVNPPAGASLVVVVTFTSPVTLDPASSLGAWVPSPGTDNTATTFTFTVTPAGQGGSLSFNLIGSAPGALTSTAVMRLINGGTTTWASESSSKSTTLVA